MNLGWGNPRTEGSPDREPPPDGDIHSGIEPIAQETASVTILAPANGDGISGDSVKFRLTAWGARIVPAGWHRLVAVVADGMHIPPQPWVTDAP